MFRRLKASARIVGANFGRQRFPLKVNLAVTYWCQYKCQTCNIWKKRPVDELSTEELLEFVRQNRRVQWVDVTGGEIFLRQDIGDVLEAMVLEWKDLVILHFPTNGYLTETIARTVRRIAPLGRSTLVVTVSLDGYQALNDRIRGIAGGFAHQIETFRALRTIRGVRVIFGMTLSRENAGQFQATLEDCQRRIPDLSARDFHLNVMELSPHYYANAELAELKPTTEAVLRDMHEFRDLRGVEWTPSAWVERKYLGLLERYLQTGITPMRCHALRSGCFIDPWGTVFPCITYSRPVGSLRDTGMSLEPIWRSQAAVDLQQEIWEYNCPQCWTACEAYQSILGNALVPSSRTPTTAERGLRASSSSL